MKKSLALVLALIMVLSSFSFVSAAPDFSDVAGTKYEDAVTRLELLNVLKGYPDGSFKPEGSITRAEFAAVAVRVKGLAAVAEASKGLPSGFSDVPAGHWAAGYVGVAGSTGIVKGIGNGLFAPNAPVKYEEAVTMLVRALGYEQDALSKGGYPYGYLIVAKEIDLLDSVAGVMGMPATRGMVAMLTDNALEIPMMVQVGFGSDAKWVVSGTREHGGDEMYLLDSMGFDTFEGRVTSYNDTKETITLKGKNNVTLDVAEGFDYYEVIGVTIKTWAKDDMVIVYTLKDDVKFDAVDFTAAKSEMKLIGEDETYDVVLHTNSPSAADFDYAKVVFNDDEEIVWVEGYALAGFILVEDVDGDVVVDLNDEELDVEDFLIVKDGKTIEIDDLMSGDILFYNRVDEFAVVYNNGTSGEITRVYNDMSFRLAGTLFEVWSNAQYLDDGELGDLSLDILEGMMDEESDVTAFVDFYGDVVLVEGFAGMAKTSSYYAVVDAVPNIYTGRSGTMVALDLIDQDAADVKLDLKNSFVTDSAKFKNITVTVTSPGGIVTNVALAKDDVVKVTVEDDGDIAKIEKLNPVTLAVISSTKDYSFKFDSTYARTTPSAVDYRLLDSTIIFYDLNTTSEKTVRFSDMEDEFTLVKAGKAYLNDKNQVIVVVATVTDNDDDTTKVSGLVTKTRVTVGGYLEVTFADGNRYLSEEAATSYTAPTLNDVYELELGNKSGEIIVGGIASLIGKAEPARVISELTRTTITTSGSSIVFRPINAKYYNIDSADKVTTIGMTDLVKGDTVVLYKVGNTVDEVNFVIRTAKAPTSGGGTVTGVEVKAINTSTMIIQIGDTLYNYAFASDVTGISVGDFVTFKTQVVNGLTYAFDITK